MTKVRGAENTGLGSQGEAAEGSGGRTERPREVGKRRKGEKTAESGANLLLQISA